MGKVPEKIACFRQKGTEIKLINGRYYLQKVKCVWDPETKKRKKVFLGHIGVVTEDGIVPRKTRQVSVDAKPYSKEFGATWALLQLTADIKDKLEECFPNDYVWLYVVAILRCIKHSAMKYIGHFYSVSYISELFPNLNLSSSNISNLMTSLGYRREKMIKFMRDFIPTDKIYVLFDGTPILCNSKQIYEAQQGYNSKGCHKPQVNLMYAVAMKGGKLIPIFYKKYPGSVRDVSAFMNMRNEMGLSLAVAVFDKGVSKKADHEIMEAQGMDYVTPVKRNSKEYSRAPLNSPGFTGFQGRFAFNGRIIWYYEQKVEGDEKHRYFLYLDETLRHLEQCSLTDKIGKESKKDIKKVAEKQLLSGTICLKTTLMKESAEMVYLVYKTRENIEQLFDIYKVEEDFSTTGMHSAETQEACFFLNHLSIMMAYKVYEKLVDNDKLNKYGTIKIMEHYLWEVRASHYGDTWQMEPVPKASRLAIEALGMAVPESIETSVMG